MSGYIPHEREPMTRQQWIAIVLAILAAGFMLFVALYASKVANGWLGRIGKVAPSAPLMFVVGSLFLIQQPTRPDAPGPVMSATVRRLAAAFFYLAGIALFALPIAHK